ncbi:hypothetical protein SAMN04487916_111112 [Arthrobacter sp. ov407]|nr:hypothetical protein SAMN04487916_111112 [Arthrobacter sp. ov407]
MTNQTKTVAERPSISTDHAVLASNIKARMLIKMACTFVGCFHFLTPMP